MAQFTRIEQQRIQLAAGRLLQWESAQDCYVLLSPDGQVELNQSAAAVLALCDGTRTRRQILDELARRYPGVSGDVDEFLDAAGDNGWIAGA